MQKYKISAYSLYISQKLATTITKNYIRFLQKNHKKLELFVYFRNYVYLCNDKKIQRIMKRLFIHLILLVLCTTCTIDTNAQLTCKYPNDGFATFLRSLPRKPVSARVKLYDGRDAGMEYYKYQIINLPILSDIEQCADVCMHLRAEYFFRNKQYSKIHFKDVSGKNHPYTGGASRQAFNIYLKQVYAYSNTYSMYHEMHTVPFRDIRPGDVFIYPATSTHLGHVMMVYDVATDNRGNIYYQTLQGYTPACEIHIMRNESEPKLSPWRRLNVNANGVDICGFHFTREQLKRW